MALPTLAEWERWSVDQRNVWLDTVLERLPDWLVLTHADAELPWFEDRRHGVPFVLVPTTTVSIGLTEERLLEVEAAMGRNPLQLFAEEVHLPVRTVTVPAHLAGGRAMRFEGQDWVHRDRVKRLRGELAARSWRLPTEVEWELHWRIIRGRAPLELTGGELCLDDWHVNYRDAPLSAAAWGESAELVRMGLEDPDAVEAHMPGRRPLRSTSVVQVRPVIDLP